MIACAGMRNEDGRRAAAQLVESGANAVVPILKELANASLDRIAPLAQTLSRIRAAEALPLLQSFTRERDYRVAPAAITAIGYSQNAEAIHVLSELLLRPSAYHDRVVEALGELGEPRGIAILKAQANRLIRDVEDPLCVDAFVASAREEQDFSVLLTLIAVAIALAKLDDQSLTGPILALSRYDRLTQVDSESAMIRLNAMHALRYLSGQGVFSALLGGLRDHNREVQESAMRAMRLLGTKQSVAAWIELVQAKDPLATFAHSMIHEIVGAWPAGNQFIERLDNSQLFPWWAEQESRFLDGTVYRFGRRAWPLDLFVFLESQSQSIINDLHVITGVDFALHVDPRFVLEGHPSAVLRTATKWWEAHERRFDHGGLYKFCYRQDLSRVFVESPDWQGSP